MTHFTQTSKSFCSKTKRGLSLSTQKKKINSIQQSTQNSMILKDLRSNINSRHEQSDRKNKIKFVQSYNKNHQTSSTNKPKFFKNTESDIKLGGSKRPSLPEPKLANFPQRNLFSTYSNNIPQINNCIPSFNSSIDFQKRVPIHSQKKLVREGNLNWNINYFQNIKVQNERIIGINQWENRGLMGKGNEIGEKNNVKVQKIEKVNEMANGVLEKGEDKGRGLNGDKFQGNKEYSSKKQSTDSDKIQKLKQVQSSIDQLLSKVSQTRAYLLR